MKHKTMLLAALLAIGLHRSWWSSISETPLFRSRRLEAQDDDGPADGFLGDAAEVGEQVGAVSASAMGDQKQTVKGSDEELKRLRSRCKNGWHFAAQVLANATQARIIALMILLFDEVVQDFDMGITERKTQWGCLERNIMKASGHARSLMARVIMTLAKPEALVEMRFIMPGHGEPMQEQVDDDKEFAGLANKLCWNMCRSFLLTASECEWTLPSAFVLLLSPQVETRAQVLVRLCEWWRLLNKLETEALANVGIKSFLSSIIFPSLVWVREVLVRLAEVEFQSVPESARQQVLAYGSMLPGTKCVEDSIGHAKGVAMASPAGKVCPSSAWHSIATGGIVKDLGWQEPQVTKAARACSIDRLPACTHRSKDEEFSLGSDVLSELQGENAAWCNASPARRRLAGSAWRLVVTLEGDWSKMSLAWLGLLVEPGVVLHKENEVGAFLVFSVTRYGILARKVDFLKVSCGDSVQFFCDPFRAIGSDEADRFNFIVVHDLARWRALRVRAVPPIEVPQRMREAGATGLCLVAEGKGSALLKAAAKTGFRQLTVYFMKSLMQYLGLRFAAGQHPRTEAEVVRALYMHGFPGASEQDIADAMSQRFALPPIHTCSIRCVGSWRDLVITFDRGCRCTHRPHFSCVHKLCM